MSRSMSSVLYWSPRILTILFAAFLGLFALDVLNEAHGFWGIVGALLLHLIPAFAILAMLVAAWRWEWIGAVLFSLAAAFYSWKVVPRHTDWAITVGGPLLAIAVLFLVDWIERAKLREAHLRFR
jgi:hypothetical protein